MALKVGGRTRPQQWVGSLEAQVCRRQVMLPAQPPLPAWQGGTRQRPRSWTLQAQVAAARANLWGSGSMRCRAGLTRVLVPSPRRAHRRHCHQVTLLLLLGLAAGSHLAHPVLGRPGSSSSSGAPGCLLGGTRCGLAHRQRARQRAPVCGAAGAATRSPWMRVQEGRRRNPDVPAQPGHACSLQASSPTAPPQATQAPRQGRGTARASPTAHMCAEQARRDSQQLRRSAGCSRHSTGPALLQGL